MSKSQMRKEAEKTEGRDICAEKEGKKRQGEKRYNDKRVIEEQALETLVWGLPWQSSG